MNEAIQNILSRRSIRSFTDQKVKKEDLETIVQCAINAPAASNQQKWRFTVIQNPKIKNEIVKLVSKKIANPDYDAYEADTLILVSGERDFKFAVHDCSGALENIFLAANALGLGSVWLSQFSDISDNLEFRAFLNSINFPENHIIIGVAAVGYVKNPAGDVYKNPDVIDWIL